MIFCQIENGVVVNRAVFDASVPEDWEHRDSWIASDDAQIGWTYDGQVFSAPAEPPVVIPIPESVSARQFKLQLLASGLLDPVEAYIAAQGKAVQIAYDNSNSFVRSEPMMAAGFAALGYSVEQIDTFFVAASKL